jgi:hypothetical protein
MVYTLIIKDDEIGYKHQNTKQMGRKRRCQ